MQPRQSTAVTRGRSCFTTWSRGDYPPENPHPIPIPGWSCPGRGARQDARPATRTRRRWRSPVHTMPCIPLDFRPQVGVVVVDPPCPCPRSPMRFRWEMSAIRHRAMPVDGASRSVRRARSAAFSGSRAKGAMRVDRRCWSTATSACAFCACFVSRADALEVEGSTSYQAERAQRSSDPYRGQGLGDCHRK